MELLGGGGGGFCDVELKDTFSCRRSFATHAGFQIQCVLLWIWVAGLWLGDLDDHVFCDFVELFGGEGRCLNGFWLRESGLAYCCGV